MATILAIAGLAIALYDVARNRNPYSLLLGVGMVAVLVGVTSSPIFQRIFESLPLRALGAVSYSLFLWHSLLIAADFPITFDGIFAPVTIGTLPAVPPWHLPFVIVPALLAAATISYLVIERPFLALRPKR